MSSRIDLDVVILTFNEERHIGRAIESVRSIARQIVVVDSFSTDRTTQIAAALGASVLQHPFVNQARQFQWALDHAPLEAAWTLRLDADEVISAELRDELQTVLPTLPDDVVGINLKRKHIFLGRWIRFGGRFPLLMLRAWRRGHGQVEDRWMDEHVLVSGGRTITLAGTFADHNLNDLSYFIDKHNKYATREAVEVLLRKWKLQPPGQAAMSTASASRQAATKRWLKDHVYSAIPYQLSSLAYFIFRMTVQLGFLDGRQGLVYHGLQGFWYRFLVGAKVAELEVQLGQRSAEERLAGLERLTGLKLTCSPAEPVLPYDGKSAA